MPFLCNVISVEIYDLDLLHVMFLLLYVWASCTIVCCQLLHTDTRKAVLFPLLCSEWCAQIIGDIMAWKSYSYLFIKQPRIKLKTAQTQWWVNSQSIYCHCGNWITPVSGDTPPVRHMKLNLMVLIVDQISTESTLNGVCRHQLRSISILARYGYFTVTVIFDVFLRSKGTRFTGLTWGLWGPRTWDLHSPTQASSGHHEPCYHGLHYHSRSRIFRW